MICSTDKLVYSDRSRFGAVWLIVSGLVLCNVADEVDPYTQEERVTQECIRHMNTQKQGNSELSQKSQDKIVQSGNWKSVDLGFIYTGHD